MDYQNTNTLLDLNDFFTMNTIINMKIQVCKYEESLVRNNEEDIEFKTTIFQMKYL